MNKTSFFFTILLFIIFCCFFIFSLQAKPVGLETAIRVGVNIYAERADLRTSDIQVIEGITKKENSENLFYIFNIKDHGYVMVAADDAVFPVLGYNFEHHYTEENHPPQFDAMLESFSEQIINVKENNLTPDAKIEKAWQRLNVEPQNFEKIRDFRAVSPLLSTTWNQGQYYNEMCPSDASSTTGNNHVWAGCVATAMAQVMKYHAHPTVGDSSHGYNHSMYGNQFADFANTTYNWANMPNNVTSLNTDVQTILYHCGVSVDMDYGPTGSGASTSTAVVPALTTYFKYDTDAVFLWKSSFSTATWEQMIRNNLDNSRPLIYRGYDPGKKSRGGHCFNLDGYQSTNHFHFNWGWSGVHNGYYYLTNLNPGTHNYTSDQGGIFDLYPEPTINYDYGDAPDPTYPTLLASNGARHPNNGQTYLGSQIDTEADGLQSSDALGDDNNNLDDEDGVTFTTTLNPGQMATVQVTVSVDGYLNAWLDFDGDGSWAEVGDQIFKDKYLTAGTHNLDFLVRGPATGVTTFARFRFCSENGLSYDGEAVDGEVEDYEVDIEPDSSIKWAQYPDLSSLGMDINASNPLILADDWQCTETSNVTDIHFWGSWKDDMYELATDVTFTLSIHSDIPAGQQADWSMPGDVLWEKTWEPTMDDIVVIENCIEDWFDPSEPLFINDDHTKCIKYNLILDPSEYFLQEGTPDQPVIYWLSIQAQPLYDVPKFGWKTSTDHWNDDAVFVTGTAPYSGDAWQELIYPVDHPYSGESIDLAFEITGEDTGEELDFGDAPDPTYPTLSANTGASHVIDYVTYMGDTIDAETDGQPNSTATGDDVANLDDEDGVTFTSILVPGYTSYVTVNTSVDGFLNAWLDFNGDGDWADSDEQIFNDATLTAGDNYLSFSVPATAIIDTTFARFRFNTAGGLSYTGEAADGEVEDYQIVIHDSIPDSKLHYPQWPDPHGWDVKFDPPNVIADDWQCIESGPVTDVHFWISFQGDNLPDPFPGIDSVHLSIHNDYEPYAGYYTPWYQSIWERNFYPNDFTISGPFYGDQGWYDSNAGTHQTSDHNKFYRIDIENIENPFVQCQDSIYWLDIYVALEEPDLYEVGWKTSGVEQFRQDAMYGWNSGGGNFEWSELDDPITEESLDMAFVITGQAGELDFGDAPDPVGASMYPTLLANNGARHVIDYVTFLGDTIDAETDGQPNSTATGDDNNNLDDEDGVTFNSSLVQGDTTDITVVASVDGVLNAWVDFDGDGSWTGMSEQIFTNTSLTAGANSLTFVVPDTAVIDTTFARFRFNLTGGLTPEGLACPGEVEDYMVEIEEPPEELDFGDAEDPNYPTLLGSNGARHVIDYVTYLGDTIDAETDGQPNSTATGDDNADLDDEDGVIFKPIMIGSPAQVIVKPNTPGWLQAWMDFNQDGDWDDADEHIISDSLCYDDSTCINYYVPASASLGETFARFRFSSISGLADTGLAPDGEVEDYKVTIADSSDIKWSQLPCKNTSGLHCHDGYSGGVYFENIIADDWLCNGGVVTDIHWWGNYEQEGAGIDYFHLSIHANDPACVPAEPPLWTANVPFTDVNETFEEYNIWGAEIYKYSYYLPEPFEQQEGTRYWLDICAYSNDPSQATTTAIWRWQESSRTTSYMLCPASEKTATGGWQHIDWVTGDTLRYSGMAFEITSEPLDTEDYGDAPDSYKTLFASNGARHTVDYSIYLGNQVDTEPDGQPTLSALGDDNNNLDDEDGVIFTTVANPGDTLIFYVTPSVDGFLHAWFDFDVNGDFAGSTEHVLNSVNITGGTQNYFSCVLPATMPTGISYARFRFTTLDTALSYTGSAPDGEVEDYRLFVKDPIENSKMHFEQWPDLDTTGMDVRLSNMILADDWKCSETGYINDFHFWASFDGDNLPAEGPGQLSFIVSIYDNVPAGQGTDFSHPGDLLFEQTIMPVEYDVSQVTDNNPEDWYDPATGTYKHTNHLQAYQYDILFNQDESIFVQEKDSVYWIAVQEYEASGDYLVGWKSTDTLHHFMDDAVYWADDDWAPIYYPPEHLWAGHTLDLSFVMTGEAVDLDFGDAPDSYKTKLANDGARHACDFVTFLGDTIDVEVDGQPTVTALGDDNNNLDDEDGVVFTSGLYQGVTDSVIVTVSSAGHLNGWIDYNCDGDFADAGEQIIVDSVFSAAGKDTIAFTVPASATADTSYARFRFSNESGLNYYGLAYSGEVEDYRVVITEPIEPLDYGDAPDTPYPTLLANNGARHANDGLTYLGAQIDVEPDGWQSINALGDDNHNLDDEDGVTFTSALHPGEQGAITVQTSIAGAYLNAWIDFNNDGDWQDTNEHIIVDSILSAGLSPLTFNIPATASVTDSTYARFRFSTLTGLNTTGFAADGEVEDYRISITEAPDDDCKMHFHQWPDTTELGIDVNATYPLLLADDFLCTESGIINSIHLWGSWYNDDYTAPTFNLTLWTDNPGGPDLHSQPQTKVWEMFFSPDQYTDSLYHFADPGEYFYFPADGIIEPNADHQIWQYDFIIPDSLAYVQEEGMIYWLGVQVFETGEFNFGWKTSFNHWNDDAVYGLYDGGVWYELTYPEEHPYYPYSIDFSFYIDCTPTTPIVSISSIGDSICVSWNAIPCADTYTIYSSNDPYATFPSGWTVEATGVTTTSWCEDVSGSIKKFYRVTAVK